MSFLDMAGAAAAIIADATTNGGAVYGITNVTMPCGPFPGSIGDACAVSLFSDALHPSARAHQILGQQALLAVGVIPEPATALLMLAGVAGLLTARRRRA
jgi:outer membrane lipase/esterase